MWKILIACVVPLLLFACGEYEKSEILFEEGRVTGKYYRDAYTETSFSVGIDAEGNTTLETDEEYHPPVYRLDFRCQHGDFTIEGAKAEEVFRSLCEGDHVIIHYREVSRIEREGDKIVCRHFEGYEFITALPYDPEGDKELE